MDSRSCVDALHPEGGLPSDILLFLIVYRYCTPDLGFPLTSCVWSHTVMCIISGYDIQTAILTISFCYSK